MNAIDPARHGLALLLGMGATSSRLGRWILAWMNQSRTEATR